MGKSARVLSAAAIAVATVCMAMAPAGASSAGVAVRHGRAVTAPNTDMAGTGTTARFVPKTLTARTFTKAKCSLTTPPTSFTVTNGTRHSYEITFNGAVAFELPKKTIESICVYGPAGTIKLGITGSTHVLKVTLFKPS